MKRFMKVLLGMLTALVFLAVGTTAYWFISPAPRVLSMNEISIEKELSFNAPFTVMFSSSMNKESVEEAFFIEPEISGDFEWKNNKTLLFKPKENLKIGGRYTLTIDNTAKSNIGKKMEMRFVQEFIIVGPPEISLVSPVSQDDWKIITEGEKYIEDETGSPYNEDKKVVYPILKKGQKITVMFSSPIRSLQTPEEELQNEEVNLSDYFETTPAIEGEFHWLGTSAFEFKPNAEKLPMGNVFLAKVKSGFPSADGGQTEKEAIWHFETAEPQVVNTTPYNLEQFVDPKKEIRITWNQEVDLESLFKNLEITPDLPLNETRKLKVIHDAEDPKITVISFEPYFSKDTNINVLIKQGVKSEKGTKLSMQDFVLNFTTLADPKVIDFWPPEGHEILPSGALEVGLSVSVTPEEMLKYLYFEPKVDSEQITVFLKEVGNNGKGTRAAYEISAPFPADQTIKWGIKEGLKDEFGQILDKGFESQFKTKSYEPEMNLMGLGGNRMLFDAEEPASVFIRSRNMQEANFTVCKVPEKKLAQVEANWGDWWSFSCDNDGKDTKKWTEKLANEKNKWVVTEVPISERVDLSVGGWFFEFSSKEYVSPWDQTPVRFFQGFYLASASLVAKISDTKVTFWATDFVNAKPIKDMEIKIYNTDGGEIGSGITNGDGFFEFAKTDSWSPFFAIGKSGKYAAFIGSGWYDGIDTWDFGMPRDWQEIPHTMGYMYTDRPIYKSGDMVYFKGIIRKDTDATLSLPKEKEIGVTINSPMGNEIYNEKLKLSENGTFYGEVKLGDTAETGDYMIYANIEGDDTGWTNQIFWVEEYRKPDFKVDVKSEKDAFINGDDFDVTISAERYFGAKMPNANLEWYVVQDSLYFDKVEGWYNFGNNVNYWWGEQQAQEIIKEGSGTLDSEGKMKISFPIELTNKSPQLFTIRATVTDATSRTVTKSETFEIYPGNILVGIKSENYFASGSDEKLTFNLITVDTKGEVEKNRKVDVKLYQVKWNSIQKEGVDGNFYWESSEELEMLSEESTKTGVDGKADVSFEIDRENPKFSGEVKAIATIKDDDNNEVSASSVSYIGSEHWVSWRRENNDRIGMNADKPSYKIGDTAKILVESPFEKPVTALVTVERKEVIEKFITKIESGKFLEIPIKDNMLPNAFVSVVLVKDKGVAGKLTQSKSRLEEIESELPEIEEKISELESKISETEEKLATLDEETQASEAKILRGTLKASNKDLETNQNKKISLTTEKDALEKEISVLEKSGEEVVSNSVTSRPEMKFGIVQLFVNTEEKSLNTEISTNKQDYLPGEEVKIDIKITDNNGDPVKNAEISLAIVDESLLALKSRNIENIVKYFWGNRGIGVSTVATLVYFTERLNVEAQKGSKGGGGGSSTDLAIKKRGEFRDTALWLPVISTDKDGVANAKFNLPDNLTTWQIWAVALTNDSKFGTNTKNFVTKKQLVAQPSLPRFAVNGDTFSASTLIINQSKDDLEVNISLNSENFNLLEDNSKEFNINSGGQKLVEFNGKIESKIDNYGAFENAKFTFKATGLNSNLVDEVEIQIPVNAPAIGESIATSGTVEKTATELVKLPSAVIEKMGNITVTISAIKTGDFTKGLRDLIAYPYGCAEQTMSAHLPNVVLKRVENTVGKNLFDLDDKELKKMVDEGLQKFSKFQLSDGGFGFWEDSAMSYPELSAYILFGLLETKKAGYSVDENMINNAISYLDQRINFPNNYEYDYATIEWNDSMKAFALFVLSEASSNNIAIGNNLFESRENLNLFGKISLLAAFQNFRIQGEAGAEKKAETLLRELEAEAKQTPRGVQFGDIDDYYYWSLDNSTRTTAFALYVFSRENPNHILIPKMIDYLQSSKSNNRYGGPWGSTQNTSWVIIGFLEWLEKSDSLNPDVTANVYLNNEPMGDKSWSKENSFDIATFAAMMDKLRTDTTANEININADSDDKLFYDIEANYFLPAELITEKNEGIGVVREYYDFDDKDMKQPLNSVKKGDMVRGKITILVPENRNFMVVDSPLPAGLEAINFKLETEDQALISETSENNYYYGDYWYWWSEIGYFNHTELRDDRILLFADWIPAGTYEYRFLARATVDGSFQLLPTIAEEMYRPEVFGRTNGSIFEVEKSD